MPDYHLKDLPRQVWAYYHSFYGSPSGPTGRWLTWNEPLRLGGGYACDEVETPPAVADVLQHDPERFLGPNRRDNYSAFYPTLGLYDCLDPDVLAQQAKWAVQAELDGIFWNYMLVGEDNSDKDKPLAETRYDRSLRIFLECVQRDDLPLSASIWYDSYCWFGFTRERIAADLRYFVETYLDHPRMLHFDGRLVVFLYSTLSRHTPEDWTAICEALAARGLREKLFLVAGEVWVHQPDFCRPGLFDGFQAYNQGVNFMTPADIKDLGSTLKRLASDNNVSFWTGTTQPGFDGRAWHHPGRVVARGDGALYESLWQAAVEGEPPMITVCSFNEWGEGTQIEPTVEYGERYLELTAKWARRYRDGDDVSSAG